MSSNESQKLTAEQRAKIERNRQRALLLRQEKQSKLSVNELIKLEEPSVSKGKDSGGGFLFEDDDDDEKQFDDKQQNLVEPTDQIKCDECSKEFISSFLRKHFDANVCNECRDFDGKHSLITRTDAKNEYLLKDCDLDMREPKLKFIIKRNPHYKARSDMRLYLRSQIEQRAIEVWGSEDELESERNKRFDKRSQRKQKQYDKKMKTLRMEVRSSLYTKETKYHEHEYDEEEYNEETDEYMKTCKTCGSSISYEKM